MADHHPVRYRRTTNEDRRRLIEAFESEDRDYIELADNLAIKRATARSIVATFLREGRQDKLPRGGNTHCKMDDEMKDRLRVILDYNPLMTLRQMKADLQAAMPHKPEVSISTIARTLDGMMFTIKLAEDVPDARNAQRVLDMRAVYAQWFLEQGVVAHLVFIDETGFNIWTRRSFGRAPRGQPARRVVHGQRGKNCTVTVAVSADVGLVHHTVASETVTRESFEAFLAETAQQCAQLLPPGESVYIIYDNARPHVRAQLPDNVGPNIQCKLLPPYSPFLNPTENAHAAFKAALKRILGRPEWQRRVGDREAAQEAGLNLQQWRRDIVQQAARMCVDVITQDKCSQWTRFRHTQIYIPRCLARDIIDG